MPSIGLSGNQFYASGVSPFDSIYMGLHGNHDGTYSIDVFDTSSGSVTGTHSVVSSINDVEQSSDKKTTWEGRGASDGSWSLTKIMTDSGGSFAIRYATVVNNPTVTDYTTAWNARKTTLIYGTYSQAFALT